jgi:prephenate dehydrogenase
MCTAIRMGEKRGSMDLGTVGIIGGKGKLGDWLRRMFIRRGYEVYISDLSNGMSVEDLVHTVDTVIVSVPLEVTTAVLDALPPLRADQLLMDVASVKTPLIPSLSRFTCEVISIHPMFSPVVTTGVGQRVVCCPIRSGARGAALFSCFHDEGMTITTTSPEEHDRAMAVVQGLNHCISIALGRALQLLSVHPDALDPFMSPIYRIRMDMIGRVLAQNGSLYSNIATMNPHTESVLKVFSGAFGELIAAVEHRDAAALSKVFQEASSHLGSFLECALEESNFLIEQLAKRSP